MAELVQELGQLFMVGFKGLTPPDSLIELIQREQVGGIILFSRNCQSASQVSRLTHDLQEVARVAGHAQPLLIATDQENGIVQRLGSAITTLPGAMALGAIDDTALIREVAEATGQELAALGINMDLAPVADVNNNPANPVIGVRSFGQEAARVAEAVAAAVEGYHAAGVAATLKHFPGHGDTAVDSHLALPTLPHTRERLERLELIPFRAGVAAGAEALMLAHVALPQVAPGENLPASLSPTVTRLAREALGYDGVIMTDCLEMGAIADGVGVPRGAVLALQAGADLVLISHTIERQRAAIAAARAALDASELDAAAIRQALDRMRAFKQRFLSWDNLLAVVESTSVSAPEHQELRDRAYRRSLTLARDEANLLPVNLPESAQIAVIASPPAHINQASDSVYPHATVVERVQRYHPNTRSALVGSGEGQVWMRQATALAQAADLIIFVALNARKDPGQQNMIGLLRMLRMRNKPIIAIAASSPYDVAAFPDLPTWLVTYEYTPAALTSAIDAIFGQFTPTGKLPITL